MVLSKIMNYSGHPPKAPAGIRLQLKVIKLKPKNRVIYYACINTFIFVMDSFLMIQKSLNQIIIKIIPSRENKVVF